MGAMKTCLRLLLVICFVTGTLSQDMGFDLSDALDDVAKPTPAKPQKPKDTDMGFDLSDAVDDVAKPTAAKPQKPKDTGGGGHFSDSDLLDNNNPNRGRPAGGGGFSDSDLVDNFNPGGGDRDYDTRGGGEQTEAKAGSGQIAGIVSAVGVALLGAASSYFAYQKKKLCFKLQGGQDPEKGQRGTHSEPQVLSNLLQNN